MFIVCVHEMYKISYGRRCINEIKHTQISTVHDVENIKIVRNLLKSQRDKIMEENSVASSPEYVELLIVEICKNNGLFFFVAWLWLQRRYGG